MTAGDTKTTTKDGLPREAFAIPGDPADADTWKLPHHKKSIARARRAGAGLEKTVDWDLVSSAVAALTPAGLRAQRVATSPEEILAAARHLAGHYLKAGRPLPDTLAALT